ncbi:daxx-like protein isoform X2 [Colletes gigas]|uniref:daxx-like protein isoform X2 n=1 Tax=Colletes gigas TaxID=935657 RepID=UPI001C9B59E6|nr:daxx-like protein isoform X2 [Colletes gigas]
MIDAHITETSNMEKDEVICISSDDEGTGKDESNSKELESQCDSHVKMEILPNEDGWTVTCGRKRKAFEISNGANNGPEKITKVLLHRVDENVEFPNVEKSSNGFKSIQKNKTETQTPKPQLIIKEKRSFSPVGQDIFPMFLSLCLQKDRSEDMKIITNKLKRCYDQLDPAYANSEPFTTFLNEKRHDIMNSTNKLYVYIKEVMSEMKHSCRRVSTLSVNGKSSTSSTSKSENRNQNVPTVSCSSTSATSTNSRETCDARTAETSENNEADPEMQDATQKKIKLILKAMEKCEKYIKKLEESEINFDDENNSSYIKLERYRYRMVELYNKLCEYTGDNADAGRQYLRPKHFSTTAIVAVDHAITSFINSKISKRNKLKKVGAYTDALIFPDYSDILHCVAKCNELHNLKLDNKKQQQIAKKAFIELGEYLQRSRRNDYWDTFSLFLEEKDDDPALKDAELANKLMQNKIEGEKRLTNIFQEYVKKQEEVKELNIMGSSTSSSENDEEKEDSSDNDKKESNNETDDASSRTDVDAASSEEEEVSLRGAKVDESNTNATDKGSVKGSDVDIVEVNEKRQTDVIDTSKDADDDNVKSKTAEDVVNIPNCKSNPEPRPLNKNDATPLLNSLSTKVANKILIDRVKENEPNAMTEESKDNIPLEEKPLLRVRSFAKPPTTWEDVHDKVDNSPVEKSTLSNNGIIDLTKETFSQSPNLTKCTTIQIGSKILPIVKSQIKTLVIPAGKNIIKKGQAASSLHGIVGINKNSTVVRLPSNQSSNQQMNSNNQGNYLLTKQNSSVIRIPQSNQTILLTTKQNESIVQSSTSNSSKSKST